MRASDCRKRKADRRQAFRVVITESHGQDADEFALACVVLGVDI